MSNIFEQVANVTINIQHAVTDTTANEKILIIGALPKVAPSTAPAKVGYYKSLAEVESAGWVSESETAANIDPIGKAAAIVFSQNPRPEGIWIAPIQTTTTEGTTTAEYASETIARAEEFTEDWYVCCPVGVTNADLALLSAYVEERDKMLIYNESAFFGAGASNTDAPAITAERVRTAGIFCKETSTQETANIPLENLYGMNVAFAVNWLDYISGSETAAYKEMTGVKPATLTAAERNSLASKNVNYFSTIGSRNVTMVGKVLGDEWMDIIRFRDWLKKLIQVRVAEVFTSVPKVPYTDDGITLIHNALEECLKSGQENGGIAQTEFTDDERELPGYTINVPKASSIPATVKQTRNLTGIVWTARLVGAIHMVTLTGTLTYTT